MCIAEIESGGFWGFCYNLQESGDESWKRYTENGSRGFCFRVAMCPPILGFWLCCTYFLAWGYCREWAGMLGFWDVKISEKGPKLIQKGGICLSLDLLLKYNHGSCE